MGWDGGQLLLITQLPAGGNYQRRKQNRFDLQ